MRWSISALFARRNRSVRTFGSAVLAISAACASASMLGANPSFAQGAISPGAREKMNLTAFGAKCDGATDDTAALAKFFAAVSRGAAGVMPPGTCRFTAPLTLAGNDWSLEGAGLETTKLLYAGASTTISPITIGNGTNQFHGVELRNFTITSSTTMTAGTGLHVAKLGRSIIEDVNIDGQDGAGKLWNGVWFDQIDAIFYTGFFAKARNEALIVNGGVGPSMKADLYISQCKITQSSVGVHIAGGFGGFDAQQCDIIGSRVNVLIDTSVAAEQNREIYFGTGAAMDTGGIDLLVNDTRAGPLTLLKLDSTWLASTTSDCLQIAAGVSYTILYNGGRIYNCGRDGIHNESKTVNLLLSNTQIINNKGIGINFTVPNTSSSILNPTFVHNIRGNLSANAAASMVLPEGTRARR